MKRFFQIIIAKLKDRRNLTVLVQAIMSVVVPVLSYMGLTAKDITSWGKLFDIINSAFQNPYVIVLAITSLWYTFNNPTESKVAMNEKVEIEENLYDSEPESAEEEEE